MNPFEHQLQTIIDTIPVLAWSARADGSIDFFNDQWVIYTGLPAEKACDWGWKVAKHPDDIPRILDVFEKAATLGQPFEVEGRIRRRDGVFRWFLIRGNPFRDPTGTIVRWYGTDIDIEDRKRAEEALRESGESFRLLINNIPGGACSETPDGKPDFLNQHLLDYLGVIPEDVSDWNITKSIYPNDIPGVTTTIQRSIATGQGAEYQVRLRRSDGVYRWFEVRRVPLRDTANQIVRWYVLFVDIDDRKRAGERVERENISLREQIDKAMMFEEIIGESPALKAAVSAMSRVAPTDSTVMLLGETGTGKELFARAIHKHSGRSGRAFVSINCAAVPQALIASELFGHEKGAFTGAQQRRLGRFELADSGTLFLDEVGELPTDTQIALLRVVQEQEFERVGGTQPIKVDVRVITATNRDLMAAVDAGTFREDLFYRLNVFPIEIPPLRQREADIPVLVEYFIDRYARKVGKKISGIDKRSMDLLRNYSWPGNIRELQNIIERAVIISESPVLSIEKSWLSRPSAVSGQSKQPDPFKRISAHEERELIEAALRESQGRVYGPSGAAARLGIPRSTLESKIRSLKINKNRFKEEAPIVKAV
ncbi:MAG TPA: sigma 54-interacting transcriptional regulator [Candidatus Sulfotelmatobacter sp.]|nr:sigma 54-interacting transcriptional regulator [Candidatus Sulfotelmatobacter sp.]